MWKYSQTTFQKDDIVLNGNRFMTGNGYFGYRGTLEEFGKAEQTACILNGVYDQFEDRWREPVNAPDGLSTKVSFCGLELSTLSAPVISHEQTLDLYAAVHRRKTAFECGKARISVHAERFASQDEPHLLCMKYAVTCSEGGQLVIRTGVDSEVWDINGPHLQGITHEQDGDRLVVRATTGELGTEVVVCEQVDFRELPPSTAVQRSGGFREFRFLAEAGREYIIIKYVSIFTSLDTPGASPGQAAISLAIESSRAGYDKLKEAHAGRWGMIWNSCDTEIDGDDEAQLAIRYSLYQLQLTAPRHSDTVSIPARGLSGQVYKGAVFWDTEMYMTPVFALTDPRVARNLILYRHRTLDGARRKAREYGFRGAFYAWESQETGDDACTDYSVNDVLTNRPLRTHFRDKQIHLSADIVHAIRQYYEWTGDVSVLPDGAAEIAVECARFLYSYAFFKMDKGRYELLDVVGPDEYHERVHNNAYTNRMAKYAIETALEMLKVVQDRFPVEYRELESRLGFAGEMDRWWEMNDGLYLAQPEPESGIIPQFDGYLSLEDVSVKVLKSRMLHPNEYLGGGSGLATTTQVLKQADVVLMLNLFRDDFPMEVKKRNWEYYEARTEHGSSLSACAYAMLAAHIGRPDLAYPYFMKTATVDLTGASKQFVGDQYIGGTHPAANGGAWMTVVFGFAGLSVKGEKICLSPNLPSHWNSLAFRYQWKGQSFSVRITNDDIRVSSDIENLQDACFEFAGCVTFKCSPGQSAQWKRDELPDAADIAPEHLQPKEKSEPPEHSLHSFA